MTPTTPRGALARTAGALALLRRPRRADLDPLTDLRLWAWQSGLVAAWWALLLLLPVHLFATAPSFRGLAAAGPEWRWGALMAALALGTLAAHRHRGPVWRAVTALAGLNVWLFVALDLALAAPRLGPLPVNTGCGAYALALAGGCARGLWALLPYALADLYGAWHLSGRAAPPPQEGRGDV